MVALGEAFTVLAILEARDKASEIFAKIDESLDKFAGTAERAAGAAKEAGATIDESLLQTASGADALDLASARVDAAQARAAGAARDQAAAERELLDAQAQAAGAADGDAAAQDRLTAAAGRLTKAQRDSVAASKELKDAEKVQSDTAAAAAAKTDTATESQKGLSEASKTSGISLGSVGKIAGITALGMGVAGALMIKAAGNFQDSTTHLVTDAGESAKNLGMVQAGILNVSTATGTSASDITNAMYHIESGGYHGSAGLTMLKVAAEGAKVGGADLDTVSKTLVGTMNAYGMSASQSASMMNQLIATTGAGDMKMQDLASSLSAVAPLAAAAHIKFSQVGGAIATMTSQGMSAQQATQDLAHTIGSLSNPNNVAIGEMNQLGLNAQDVSQHLGSQGLTGTLMTLTKAITDHMPHGGAVIMSAFTQSTTAGQDLKTMLGTMPGPIKSLADQFMAGKLSTTQWQTALKAQTPVNAHLMGQFATLYEKSQSFNSILAQGGPAAQTYTAALSKMMGGATGLKTALMLSQDGFKTFKDNTATVAAAAKKGGSEVDNWKTIQGTFNFKMSQAKTGLENTGIAIGSSLLPAATKLMSLVGKILVPIAEWTAKHQKLTEILFVGITAVAATIAVVALAKKAFDAVSNTIKTLQATYKGIMKIFGLAGEEQAAGAQAGATATEDAAAQTEAAAGEAAAAEETAAAESSGSWLSAAGDMIASAAKWVAEGAANIAKFVAENAVGAAKVLADWAATAAGMVAQAAKWVAEGVGKVAMFVAENVAGAATAAAAWIAENATMMLGIGALVALVAVAVYEIVTHWKTITKAVSEVWDWVYSHVTAIIKDIINWVKGNWPILVGIVTGPLGLIVSEVIQHWNTVKKWFSDGVHAVESILSWFGRLPGLFTGWLSDAARAVNSAGNAVLGWFSSLPGKVWGWMTVLYQDMIAAGKNVVIGIWNGIVSMGSWLWNQIMSFGNSIINGFKSVFHLGSPSKVTHQHGQWLAEGLANGILAGQAKAVAAARQMATSVLAASSGLSVSGHTAGVSLAASSPSLAAVPAGGAGAGGINLIVQVNNPTVFNDNDARQLVNKLGPPLVSMLAQAGRKVRA